MTVATASRARSRSKPRRQANASRAITLLEETQRMRLNGIAAGTWPPASAPLWQARARRAQAKLDAGDPLSIGDHHALQVVAALAKTPAGADAGTPCARCLHAGRFEPCQPDRLGA